MKLPHSQGRQTVSALTTDVSFDAAEGKNVGTPTRGPTSHSYLKKQFMWHWFTTLKSIIFWKMKHKICEAIGKWVPSRVPAIHSFQTINPLVEIHFKEIIEKKSKRMICNMVHRSGVCKNGKQETYLTGGCDSANSDILQNYWKVWKCYLLCNMVKCSGKNNIKAMTMCRWRPEALPQKKMGRILGQWHQGATFSFNLEKGQKKYTALKYIEKSKVIFSILKKYLSVQNWHGNSDSCQHSLRHILAQGYWPDETEEETEAHRS